MIRVVIAEDQGLVLGALAALLDLEDDINVVATAVERRGRLVDRVRHVTDAQCLEGERKELPDQRRRGVGERNAGSIGQGEAEQLRWAGRPANAPDLEGGNVERADRRAPGPAEPGDDAPAGGEVGEPHGRGSAAKCVPDLAGEAMKGSDREPISEGGLGERQPYRPRGSPIGWIDGLEPERDDASEISGREDGNLGPVADRGEESGGEYAVSTP